MQLSKLASTSPLDRGDFMYQTTPSAIDADVFAFCAELGGLTPQFVPVLPAPHAETGMCHANVSAQVKLHGGRLVFGWALWKNQVFLMAEFHVVWKTTTGQIVDVTPAAEGEETVLFAADPTYPENFDFWKRPLNRATTTVPRTNPDEVRLAIEGMSPTQRAYEEKRAAKKQMDLASHIGAKSKRAALAAAVDDLIQANLLRDQLIVPTATGIYSKDPAALRRALTKAMAAEDRVRDMLADGYRPATPTRAAIAPHAIIS